MKVIITLSGNSERFTTNGYTIKPIIKINRKLKLNYFLDMLPTDKIKYE